MQPIKKIMGFNTEEPDKPTKLTIQGPCNKTLGRIMAVFGKGLDWKKWIGTVADLINMRKKKVRIFCIEK
jgi:hypothetical protein